MATRGGGPAVSPLLVAGHCIAGATFSLGRRGDFQDHAGTPPKPMHSRGGLNETVRRKARETSDEDAIAGCKNVLANASDLQSGSPEEEFGRRSQPV